VIGGVRRRDLAELGDAALVPRVCRKPDDLIDLRRHCQLVPRALRAACAERALVGRLIVQHQVVVLVPARGISADEGRLDLVMILLNRHEEDTIVSNLVIGLVEQV